MVANEVRVRERPGNLIAPAMPNLEGRHGQIDPPESQSALGDQQERQDRPSGEGEVREG